MLKYLIRNIWIQSISFLVTYCFRTNSGNNKNIKIFYGGARGGSLGGPLVKVSRLKKFYGEFYFRPNLVYALSNCPYINSKGLASLKKKNIHLVLNQNGIFHKNWYNGNCEAMNYEMSLAYRSADYVFWQSNYCRKNADKYLGRRVGGGEVLFNAVDIDLFKPNFDFKNKKKLSLLIAGKFDLPVANRLFDAINLVDKMHQKNIKVELLVAGWLNSQLMIKVKRLLSQKKNINDEIKFLGPYSQRDAPMIYRMADIFLMTKHYDACPNTVIEAMSSGLPVVYSNTGGTPELVDLNCGIGVDVLMSDEKKIEIPEGVLLDAILTVQANKGEMSKSSRQRAVELFNLNSWIDRHNVIFNMLLRT